MRQSRLGIAVLGVGVMGERHAENLVERIPQAEVVAVVDVDAARARAVAAKLGVPRSYTSVEEAVGAPGVEAVVIASPAKVHPQAIQLAAAAGKSIFCEKPLALTLAEADQALAAVEKAGLPLQIGFMRRYDPAYAEAKQRIEAGEIGTPLVFKAIGRDPEPPPLSYFQSGLSGSLFLDSSIHEFDLARWLMQDEVKSVEATGAVVACAELAREGDVDVGFVNLQFTRGGVGSVESYRSARYGYDIRTELLGSQGALQIGTFPRTSDRLLLRSPREPGMPQHFLERFDEAYLLELRDFVVRVLAGQPPRVSGLDGRQALAIALAAERSHHESRRVWLEEYAPPPAARTPRR